jgi:flagellar hook-associated protein 3 FlgL
MGLRVNPDLQRMIVDGLAMNTKNQDQALQQLATGQRLNSLSDDPAAVASLIGLRAQSSSDTQYLQNISSLTGALQVSDSTMGSVVEALTQAVTLGIQGANGTLTTANRQAIAQVVQGVQQQVLNLANTSYNGRYLFSGTATTTRPYALDPNAASGVQYNGNDNRNSVEISSGQAMPINLPGSFMFTQKGVDVFQALQDLHTALQNNGDVGSATDEVQNALSYVTTQRTFYGNSVARLNTAQTFLNQEKLQLSQAQSDKLDVDMAKAVTDLTQTETTQAALLAAAGKISQSNLFDYLPSQ